MITFPREKHTCFEGRVGGPLCSETLRLGLLLSTDKLVKCKGISLWAQSPSWLLLLLLALPLQVVGFSL